MNDNHIDFDVTDHMKELIDYENFEDHLHIKEKKSLEDKIKKLERKLGKYQKDTQVDSNENKPPTFELLEKMDTTTKNLLGFGLLAVVIASLVYAILYLLRKKDGNKKEKKDK